MNCRVSDAVFSVTFERPDLQKMTIEARRKIYEARLGDKLVEKLGDRLGDRLGDSQVKIISLIKNEPKISIPELAEKIKISTTAVEKNIKKLKDKGILKRVGTTKSGYWEVLE